ncbi:MAG: sigma-70 family RNA polymerase sigma factor [Alphaproteobacteria bacterium]|nr:sigma-70 family RNA polymerase sigma factor [Alphaproteobacteria bacterium]
MAQDELFLGAIAEFGPALARLAAAYEADWDQRRDLLQDVKLALWRSFAGYAGQCSMRTWVFRVAHNTAISTRLRRRKLGLVSLDELADLAAADDPEATVGNAHVLARLQAMIRRLKPPDDQVMLLYLEDQDAAAIAEITGLSAGAVATRIHRVKQLLSNRLRQAPGQQGEAA